VTTINKTYLTAGIVVVILAVGGLFALRRPGKPTGASSTPAVHAAPAPVPVAAPPPAADCQAPGMPPPAPDGDTATAEEMRAGHDRIQAFVNALEAYQACRNSQIDHAAPTVTAAQKQTWLDEGNAAVDEANVLASAFSAQLKLFKAKHPDQ
jgi:hypothetical protein